jgi:hypothetical protein
MPDGIFPSGKNYSADNDGDYDFSNCLVLKNLTFDKLFQDKTLAL